MAFKRRNLFAYGLLLVVWLIVVGWQIEEHKRVKEVARTGLLNRSKDIANTLSAFIRGLQFRGAVLQDRLEPVMNELVEGRTNDIGRSSEVMWIALLNASGEPLASAGIPVVNPQKDAIPESGWWEDHRVTLLYTVEGASVAQEGAPKEPTVVAPPFRELTNAPPEGGRTRSRRDRPDGPDGRPEGPPPPPGGDNRFRDGENRPRRPFWARGMEDEAYQALIKKRELHGLVLTLSTDTYRSISFHDLWLRSIIVFFSTLSVVGVALAWRNLSKSSDLQLRLVRASELNTHLKEMNLAAAGLAHETRNPLNIIRGMAQLISKQASESDQIREKSRAIVDETDKVTAQLNEFINYSRPRELHRSVLSLNTVVGEVTRALSYDFEEKKIKLEVKGDPLSIEADEHLLRQVVFNLVLNAIQALGDNGEIQILTHRLGAAEGSLEIRDNGPGVPPENRKEIFKPYFTTQQKGTGLGLAIVQQNVLAHGWEIECLGNQPKGAIFRVTHLKLATKG